MRIDPSLSEVAEKNVRKWLSESYDEATKKEIRDLLQNNIQQVEESFYTYLSFGTGGIRGLMGVGTNRMNVYTVRKMTQAVIDYTTHRKIESPKIVVGYDTRINSRLFAEQVAKVASSNGWEALLIDSVCPTPILSFAVRKLGCIAGVMITASHNPPEYNGYKLYWSDGGQVLSPHDKGIRLAVEAIRTKGLSAVHYQENAPITLIGPEIFQAYLQEIKKLMLWPSDEGKERLKILYTSLHGTGGVVMEQALRMWGMPQVAFVSSQMVMDGSFPTTKTPNPESHQALSLGIDQLMKEGHDIFLATDPDADRVGLVVRHHGKPYTLTGNQIASLMAEWILKRLYEEGRMPPRPALVKSIVTTPLLKRIAEYWNASQIDVLTGFKYIAEQIRHWEESSDQGYSFVFGAEESLGFLYGTHARDKDAIVSSCVIAEIAAHFKKHSKTLVDGLHDLWKKYGVFLERVRTVSFPETKEGRDRMMKSVDALRKAPPDRFGKYQVEAFEDLLHKQSVGNKSLALGQTLPVSDVLLFYLEGGGLVCIRPSGTEPKVKVYAMLSSPYSSTVNMEHVLDKEISDLLSDVVAVSQVS